MFRSKWNGLLLGTAVVIANSSFSASVQAESVLDWVYGRQPVRQVPATVPMATFPASTPMTFSGAPANSSCCTPSASTLTTAGVVPGYGPSPVAAPPRILGPVPTTYASPASACCPQPVNCCPQPTVCQRVTRYAPCTAYRTRWSRVPVTYYRPVTMVSPTTGCTTTCMKPCTRYRWQARRVAYTTYRPVYSTLPVRTPSQCGTCSPYASGSSFFPGATSTVVSPGCSSCSSTPGIPATRPFGLPTQGQTQQGQTQPQTVPGGAAGSLAPVPAGTVAPADTRPSLVPSEAPVQGASTQGISDEPVGEAQSDPAWIRSFKIQPIPDDEVEPSKDEDENRAPDLLDPRDRTVSRPPAPRETFTTAVWSKPRQPKPAKQLEQTKRHSSDEQSESDGWYSVAP